MVPKRLAFANLLAALAALAPGAASAQVLTGADRDGHTISLELGAAHESYAPSGIGNWFTMMRVTPTTTPGSSRAVLFGGLAARIRVLDAPHGRGRTLDLDFVWRGLGGTSLGEAVVAPGDPYLGFRFGQQSGHILGRAGIGLTLPVGVASTQPHEVAPYAELARQGNVLWDPWLTWPGHLAIVARADFAIDEGFITAGTQAGIGVAVPVGVGTELGFVLESAGWVGLRLGPVDLGIFGNLVGVGGGAAPWGSALGPFLRLRAGALTLEARGYLQSPPGWLFMFHPDVAGSVSAIVHLDP